MIIGIWQIGSELLWKHEIGCKNISKYKIEERYH